MVYLSPYHVTASIFKCYDRERGRWLMAQTSVRRKSRLRVKGLKVKDREKIKEAIAISVRNGNYTTREIGVDIGKDHSTISRYLSEMEHEEKWGIKRDANGNIIISLQRQLAQDYRQLEREPFNQLPSVQKWTTFLKSGGIPPKGSGISSMSYTVYLTT